MFRASRGISRSQKRTPHNKVLIKKKKSNFCIQWNIRNMVTFLPPISEQNHKYILNSLEQHIIRALQRSGTFSEHFGTLGTFLPNQPQTT